MRIGKSIYEMIRHICRAIVHRYRDYTNYGNFPMLWRKHTEVPFGTIGVREWIGLNSAAMWYVKNHRMRIKNCSGVMQKLKECMQTQYSVEDKKIIFIIELVATARLEKITKALCKRGYRITLLYNTKMVPKTEGLERLKEYCEAVHGYNRVAQLLYYTIESRIPIVHFYVAYNNFASILLLLQVKGIMPRIIAEKYDIFNGTTPYKEAKKRYCRAEKYFMEHSDGVCCREFSMEYCVKELGFELRREYLVFLDYAEEQIFEEKEKQEELSLCYVGEICTEKEYPGASYACFLELAAKCERNNCHLHVYPFMWSETRFSQYIKYAQNSQYFHFHHPVEHNKLYEEISQYDYGIHPVKSTYLDREIDGCITRNKLIYASTNKYFDYISAGIPIIGISPVIITKEIEKTGGIIRWSIDDYDFDELKRRKKELRDELLQNRGYWMIDNRISELTDYYEEVLQDA